MTEQVELRGGCPRWIVDVLDAVAISRNVSRTEVVNQILERWAQKKLAEASVICRVARRNGMSPELIGKGEE